MAYHRKVISETTYRDHRITVRFCGPDLTCEVNGKELGPFYLDAEHARKAGMRHIDQVIAETRETRF